MEVIMLKDVHNVGHQYQIVTVANGYANNHLLPQGLAEVANEVNRKRLAETLKQTEHKEKKIRQEAEALAEKLAENSLVISAKTDENGRIFGSITEVQIALALQKKGFTIEPRQIRNTAPIKEVGTYQAAIQVYKDIQAALNIEVTSSTEN